MEDFIIIKEEECLSIMDDFADFIDTEILMETSCETTISIEDPESVDIETFFSDEYQIITDEYMTDNGVDYSANFDILELYGTKTSENDLRIKNEKEELSCTLCQLNFTSLSYLHHHFNSRKHQRLEARLYRKTINDNPQTFIDYTEVKDNFQIIQEDPFSFRVESIMSFAEKPNIWINNEINDSKRSSRRNSSHENRRTRHFQCKYCYKNFSTCSNLRRHENLHINPVDLYYCHICSKKFRQKEYLKKHLSTHLKPKTGYSINQE